MIVDVQKDFCPGGALGGEGAEKVVPKINKLMDKFDLTVASKDWHPEDTVHFEKWPIHCVKYSEGSEFHQDLNASGIDQVFYKGTENKDDGYSAFEATNKNLEKFLKDNRVEDLYVVGLTTEFCVKSSALDAAARGFNTYVVTDAIRPVNSEPGGEEKALKEMENAGCKFVQTQDLID